MKETQFKSGCMVPWLTAFTESMYNKQKFENHLVLQFPHVWVIMFGVDDINFRLLFYCEF